MSQLGLFENFVPLLRMFISQSPGIQGSAERGGDCFPGIVFIPLFVCSSTGRKHVVGLRMEGPSVGLISYRCYENSKK